MPMEKKEEKIFIKMGNSFQAIVLQMTGKTPIILSSKRTLNFPAECPS
jgi:hypothetical protein